jgi:hypothetical protein
VFVLSAIWSLARIGVDARETVAHQFSLHGMLAGATACLCGIYEVTPNRAWCARSNTARALILMVGFLLLAAVPVLLVRGAIPRGAA